MNLEVKNEANAMAEQGRKRVIRRIKYFTSRVDRFYAKYDVHNYASNIRISRQKLLFMHKNYTGTSVCDAFLGEKLRERFENLSLTRRNLSLSF